MRKKLLVNLFTTLGGGLSGALINHFYQKHKEKKAFDEKCKEVVTEFLARKRCLYETQERTNKY